MNAVKLMSHDSDPVSGVTSNERLEIQYLKSLKVVSVDDVILLNLCSSGTTHAMIYVWGEEYLRRVKHPSLCEDDRPGEPDDSHWPGIYDNSLICSRHPVISDRKQSVRTMSNDELKSLPSNHALVCWSRDENTNQIARVDDSYFLLFSCSALLISCSRALDICNPDKAGLSMRKIVGPLWPEFFHKVITHVKYISSSVEAITDEHGLDTSGKFTGSDYQREKLDVYFSEVITEPQNYVPRAILLDSKSDTRARICTGPLRTFFHRRNLLFRGYGAGQCWAVGYHTAGAELIDEAMDMVRREAEECECLQGFQIVHSLGGGTGGGMGSLLISRLCDEYPDRVIATFSIFPSRVPDVVVKPYNVTLSMNRLIEDSDATFCIDNQALVDTCTGTLGQCDPSHGNLSRFMAQAMSGVTACFRFPGQLNSDLRKLTTTMVPLSRLHFFTLGVSPLSRQTSESSSVPRITQKLFSSDSIAASVDHRISRSLSCLTIFRGKVSMAEIEAQLDNLRNKRSPDYIEWVPNDIRCTAYLPHDYDMSGTLLINSTSIQNMFSHVSEQFSALYRRKAYINPYTWNGVDEMDFVEAESNMNDLIEEYREHQDGPI
ncbi:beta tubulin [Aspergillus oryzae 100-8]|uniref:Beta tubulin n=1 Tax=Aspergillus oryzae (strain 3.042) TaxID=1160506 RepID=I8TGQ4_ASPO3|nr:beta tubulin [Aspergillus oryzae 3.042]KDE84768.1 beta tubulin [Aspergillus oryzae 100-8]|eukprot:EIT72903.1 beta tubulin [Aspergillus oryzae 3.042]